MNNKEKIDSIMNERLRRLVSEFELDLMRLLKTASFLSLSKDVLQKHVNYIFSESTNFQKNLGNFTISLLELEKKISEQFTPHGEKTQELVQDLKIYIDDLNLLINEYIHHSKEANDVLEKKRNDDINNIEALNNLYNLELRSAQTEFDSRLKRLESSISKTISEASGSDSKTINSPSSSTSRTQENKISAAASINSKSVTLKNPQIIISSLVSMFLGLIIGIALFYSFTSIEFPNKDISSKVPNISSKTLTEMSDKEKQTAEEKESIPQELSVDNNLEQKKKNHADRNELKSINQKKLLSIKHPGANIRKGPGINYTVISTAEEGEILQYLSGERGIWMKIKTRDGKEGWISKKRVREVDE